MCLFGGGDGGAKAAEEAARREAQREAERQERIAGGRYWIDQHFSRFDPEYYAGRESDYIGYYDPILEDQRVEANKRLTLDLARRGLLMSSAGVNQLQKLKEYTDSQRNAISAQAADAAGDLRDRVEANRASLLAQNATGADPAGVASGALNSALALDRPQTFSPLGDVFSNFFANLANYDAVSRSRPIGAESLGSGGARLFLSPGKSSGSSGRVVGI